MSKQSKCKWHFRKEIAILFLLLAAFVFIAVGCSSDQKEAQVEEPVYMEEESLYGDESLGIDAGVDEKLRDYRSVLIAGIDNGNRADMLIVLCMNEKTGDIKMFTVTRDAYMQIAHGETVVIDDREYEFCKCNRAYEIGTKYDLMKELNRHLDLNIKEFIGINWACTAKLVDAVGGIECDIQSQDMLDAINKLISGASEGDNQPIASIGKQTLTGWQAVQYLRVRKYEGGSPMVREERSRDVLNQILKKIKEMTVEEVSDVYDEIAGELDTNMSRSTLTETLASIGSTEIDDQGGWPYEYEVKWEKDKHFNYIVPQTLYSNVRELHAAIFGQEEYATSNTVQQLSDRIEELEENYLK